MAVKLPPMMSYYGSKRRASKRYPKPLYDTIIEPFAGGAGYSLEYYDRDVILIEKNYKVVGVWQFLIQASKEDILSLPLLSPGQRVYDFNIPVEAQWLIGWWCRGSVWKPGTSLSPWAEKTKGKTGYWGEGCRKRLAEAVPYIKHWQIIEGDYTDSPDIEATWFIDPPYQGKVGRNYPCHKVNYEHLADWCKSRRGQVIVCEHLEADWLPFEPLFESANGRQEVVWTK